MNTKTLMRHRALISSVWIIGVLLGFPSLTRAESKHMNTLTPRNELVLTLSEDALMPEEGQGPHKSMMHNNGSQIPPQATEKPVNLGCGMDLSPFGSNNDNDNSLGNRLVGECNLNYNY